MPDFSLFCLLLSRIDQKTLALLRLQELQNQFLKQRVSGRLIPNACERAAFGRLMAELELHDLKGQYLLFHPETFFKWHRELISQKYDSSKKRGPGRPSSWHCLSDKVLEMAQKNPTWGAPRIHGQLKQLGFGASEPTVWRLMRRLGLDPNPHKPKHWSTFLRQNKEAIVASDFFTVETMGPKGLRSLYGLFFIQHDTRQVLLGGITEHPNEAWVTQIARNLTMSGEPFFQGRKYLIMDRDTKYCKSMRDIFTDAGIKPLMLPHKSPDMNAIAERWIRSLRQECLNHLPLISGEAGLAKVLKEYIEHYNHERAHQGLGNTIPLPTDPPMRTPPANGKLQSKSRLGGLLNYYYWERDLSQKRAA